jgi:hypothetical protein
MPWTLQNIRKPILIAREHQKSTIDIEDPDDPHVLKNGFGLDSSNENKATHWDLQTLEIEVISAKLSKDGSMHKNFQL